MFYGLIWPSSFWFVRHQHDTLGFSFSETRDVTARILGNKFLQRNMISYGSSRNLFALAFIRRRLIFLNRADAIQGGNSCPRLQPCLIGFCRVLSRKVKFFT